MTNAAMTATESFGGRRPGRRSREREARSKSCSSRLSEQETMWTRIRAVELYGHSADQTERKQLSATVSHEQWHWSVQKTTRSKRTVRQRERRARRDSRSKTKRSPSSFDEHQSEKSGPTAGEKSGPTAGEKSADPQRVKRARTHSG